MRQPRRSISITGALYKAIRDYCEQTKQTASGLVENELRRVVGMQSRDFDRKALRKEIIKAISGSKQDSDNVEIPIENERIEERLHDGSPTKINRAPGNIRSF
jgi:hypothetical protein